MEVTGVILAGGKSSRMGTDKGLMDINGSPMIQSVINALTSVTEKIVISTNNKDYNFLGLPLIPDLKPGIGPIGGIYSVMGTMPKQDLFIISCDLPYINNKVLQYIQTNSAEDITVPKFSNGEIQPLCGIYSHSIYNIVKEQVENKNYKVFNLLRRCKTNYLDIPKSIMEKSNKMFKNINSPDDL